MAAAAPAAADIRKRVLEASGRIRRVKALDRLATGVITFGGILIVIAVSFIFVFILGEAVPLFRPAAGVAGGTLNLAAVPPPAAPPASVPVSGAGPSLAAAARVGGGPTRPLAFGTDEYQLYLYELLSDGRVVFFRSADGSVARQFPLTPLAGAGVASASRSLVGDFLGVGTADGRVSLHQVRFRARYQDQKLSTSISVRERGIFEVDAQRRPIREVAYVETDGRKTALAVAGDDEIFVVRTDGEGAEHREALRTQDGERVTHVRIGRSDTLVASTERGNLYHWELAPSARLTEVKHVSDEPITAVEYVLGDTTLIVGDAKGTLSGWFRVRLKDEDPDPQLVNAHRYRSQGVAIRAIGASPRDKSFVTAGADGSLVLRHMTSERTVLRFPATGREIERVNLTPKMDGIIAEQADGRLARYEIQAPHPEITWKALFGKVWYEGYAKPGYTWQSTGGTDDFEAKFSLVPLVFGTVKGTFYALLFAIPLAIMGALYTSQFMHPAIKAKVKPTVEIMAALPSVVVGFIAGLWLASRVEREIVPVLLMVVLLPLFGTLGIFAWGLVPRAARQRLRPGTEIVLILPLVALGGWVALQVGPVVAAGFFGGDLRVWLAAALGLVYDQRNCVVVGLAMGFAVIPIIFTIAEDSFSSVPQHLTAASLALGASRWQTATRVVLPTASPGSSPRS
jgi:phosphate transport system permease protein